MVIEVTPGLTLGFESYVAGKSQSPARDNGPKPARPLTNQTKPASSLLQDPGRDKTVTSEVMNTIFTDEWNGVAAPDSVVCISDVATVDI